MTTNDTVEEVRDALKYAGDDAIRDMLAEELYELFREPLGMSVFDCRDMAATMMSGDVLPALVELAQEQT